MRWGGDEVGRWGERGWGVMRWGVREWRLGGDEVGEVGGMVGGWGVMRWGSEVVMGWGRQEGS